MNKSYRTVWNATTGTWTAAAETARMRTKSKSNTTMKSSVTAAVAVMTGVGGGAMSLDANAQAANGNGSLVLCGPTSGPVYGQSFGSGGATGTRLTGGCVANPSRISQNRDIAFQLYNHSNGAGGGVGQPSAATEAGISGSKNGHLVLLGGSGVHIVGPADFDNNVNMTNHRINNLAAGTAGTDAVNVNQLNAAIAAAGTANPYVVTNTGTYAAATAARAGSSATAIGANANAGGTSAVALGGNTVASATNAVALGTLANATGAETVAVGVGARATGNNSTAMGRAAAAASTNATSVGYSAYAGADGATALGTTASAVGANAIAVGRGASTSGTYGSAIGYSANATTNAVAIGVLAKANSASSVALGERASATGATATALGRGALASGTNSVALGANSVGDRNNAVSVGSTSLQRQIVNVAAGTQNTDAVNVGQLKDSGLIGDDGKSIAAVTYDRNADGTPNYGTVTLGNGAGPTQIKNVADATDDHDALNLGQLKDAGLVGDDGKGNLTSMAVTYDGAARDKVTLAGADGTTLSNVKAGVANMDAVNVGQLKDSGLIGDDGKSIAAVTYDRNADGTPNYGSVTLGNGAGPTQVKNVADATDDHDALNLGQLKDAGLVGDDGKGNLTSMAVTYDGAARDKVTLAGTDGTTLSNVKAGVADMDAVNVSQLKDSGLIGDDGKSIAAVTYDRNADGTPNYGTVTLGNGAGPTQVKNVADATDDHDA
ncbi:hypothetical protein A8E94_07090, partial [Burkholderia cenocepacia]